MHKIQYIKNLVKNLYGLSCDVQEYTHTWGIDSNDNIIDNEGGIFEAIVRDPVDASTFLLDPANPDYYSLTNAMYFGDLYISGYDGQNFYDFTGSYNPSIRNWQNYFQHQRDPQIVSAQAVNTGIRYANLLFTNIHLQNAIAAGIDELFDDGVFRYYPDFLFLILTVPVGGEVTEFVNEFDDLLFVWSMILDGSTNGILIDSAENSVGTNNIYAEILPSGDLRAIIETDASPTAPVILVVTVAEMAAAGIVFDGTTYNGLALQFLAADGTIGLFYSPSGGGTGALDYELVKITTPATVDLPLINTANGIAYGTPGASAMPASSTAATTGNSYNPVFLSGGSGSGFLSYGNGRMSVSPVLLPPLPFTNIPSNLSFHFTGYKLTLRGYV